MNVSRLRVAFVAISLLTGGPAFAQYNLTVTARMQAGAPAGTIGQVIVDPSSLPTTTTPSISCSTDGTGSCVGAAAAGATVILAPADVSNSTFAGWYGCSSTAGNLCSVNMTAAKAVTANFRPATFPLTTKTYSTTATLVSYLTAATTPAIDCETRTGTTHTACTGAVAALATNVVVTAVPAAGTKVTAWAGCTPATATTCTIATMSASKLVTATFGPANIPITAQVSGGGTITSPLVTGKVTDAMSCSAAAGADCTAQVVSGQAITLTAAAATGYSFIGWNSTPTGLCSGTAATCTIASVTSAASVGGTFRSTSCNSCHGIPPSSHVASNWTAACGDCHAGYTGSSVNTSLHMDGTKETGGNPYPPAPAGDGFNVEVQSAVLAAGAHPVVTAKFTDNAGNPLDMSAYWSGNQFRAGWTATGSASTPRIGIAMINADGTFNQMLVSSLTGATASSSETLATTGAQFAALGGGVYNITLTYYLASSTNTASGALNRRTAYDPTKTYRIMFFGGRYGFANKSMLYAANATKDLVPDGVSAQVSHDIMGGSCMACHGATFKIDVHGNSRFSAQVCKMCHFDGYGARVSYDPGSGTTTYYDPSVAATMDMGYQNFVHRLHNGLNTKDHFPVAKKMAPSHSLYFEGAGPTGGTSTPALAVLDPELTTDCGICHRGPDASVWYQKPSRKACGSCHDINWTTGTRFSDGATVHAVITDDSLCAICHPATGSIGGGIWPVQKVHGRFFEPNHNLDFTASIPALATAPRDFRVTLMDVSAVGTTVPTLRVSATLDGAAYDIKAGVAASTTSGGRVATCAFQIAGPTTDYVIPNAGSTAVSCTPTASWTATGTPGEYTFKSASATFFAGKPVGYYTAAFEIMYTDQVAASNGDIVRHPASANPNFLTVKWDGTSATVATSAEAALFSRRTVVDFAKCNSCHYDLGFHSNRGRKGPDYCATCHNPKLDNGGRARFTVAEAWVDAAVTTAKVYLPESVSLNVFIHRIHMGEKLPSVAKKELALAGFTGQTTPTAVASPWVPVPNEIKYGATRSNFVGLDATTKPNISDFTEFNMPNPMGRCDQCHINDGAKQTWALNEGTGLAPIERTYRLCDPVTPTWATEPWCNIPGSAGAAKLTTVVTPPLKAVCTSCHDSAATNAHTDLYTINPMTAGAIELCVSCHGAGKTFDSLDAHRAIP